MGGKQQFLGWRTYEHILNTGSYKSNRIDSETAGFDMYVCARDGAFFGGCPDNYKKDKLDEDFVTNEPVFRMHHKFGLYSEL